MVFSVRYSSATANHDEVICNVKQVWFDRINLTPCRFLP